MVFSIRDNLFTLGLFHIHKCSIMRLALDKPHRFFVQIVLKRTAKARESSHAGLVTGLLDKEYNRVNQFSPL